MSNEVFPSLAGKKWDCKRIPLFKTRVQRVVSGAEVRTGKRVYPLWQWKFAYDFLRMDFTTDELESLLGFYLQHRGAEGSFLFEDVNDNAISSQAIDTGDGSETEFQLIRTYGSFSEPVTEIMTSPAPKIYLTGVEQTSGYSIGTHTGLLTFTTAPTSGVAITADFSYYWRTRFEEYGDGDDGFNEFAYHLFDLGEVTLLQVR